MAGVHALVATGVNADGHREILGLDVASAEDGAGWLAFWRGLVARGLSGVQLVTADAHPGLVAAIGAALPGASWQRCRSHYLRNLLTKVPKSAQPHVATQVRTIFDQADAAAVQAQFDRVVTALADHYPEAAEHLEAAREDCWPLPSTLASCGAKSGPIIPRSDSTKKSAAAPTWSASSPAGHP